MVSDAFIRDLAVRAKATRRAHRVPGMAVGIVDGGNLVFAQGFGTRKVGQDQPVTPQSVFSAGAIAKSVTAAAIMQLVETGALDVDRPVTDYLPYFQLADPRYPAITIRHLLAHTSGLPYLLPEEQRHEDFYNLMLDRFHDDLYGHTTIEDYVQWMTKTDVDLVAAPGERFVYSDLAYSILGDVIHKVTGQEFEDYCRERIFRPLGMARTTFRLSEVDPALLVTPHIYRHWVEEDLSRLDDDELITAPIFPHHGRHAPSACLLSNVEDLSRWAAALLDLDRGGAHFLRPENRERLWQPLSQPSYTSGYGFEAIRGYGWGCYLVEHAGQPVVAMLDSEVWMKAAVMVLRSDRPLAVVILANYHNSRERLGHWALSRALGSDT